MAAVQVDSPRPRISGTIAYTWVLLCRPAYPAHCTIVLSDTRVAMYEDEWSPAGSGGANQQAGRVGLRRGRLNLAHLVRISGV